MILSKLRIISLSNKKMFGKVDKGWGYEQIWCSNDLYCGKYLVFSLAGNKFSMHFHKEKHETWIVQKGSFIVRWIDTETAEIKETVLSENDTWCNLPLVPHQLEALEDHSIVVEVSTADSIEDNFRVFPGDSQT